MSYGKKGLLDYPLEDGIETGYKVSWLFYENENKAKLCSEIAKYNAYLKSQQGYDFGYCYPSHIEVVETDGDKMFKVTIP